MVASWIRSGQTEMLVIRPLEGIDVSQAFRCGALILLMEPSLYLDLYLREKERERERERDLKSLELIFCILSECSPSLLSQSPESLEPSGRSGRLFEFGSALSLQIK